MRKKGNRTLIQLGGLIDKTNLTNLLGIKLGEDLQLQEESWDKAALLAGLLDYLSNGTPDLLLSKRHELLEKGYSLLRGHQLETIDLLNDRKIFVSMDTDNEIDKIGYIA